MTQQTYSYDDSLVTKGALAVWEDGQWRKVSEVTYMRDEQGHVTKQIEKADEVTVTTKYTFDKAGNLNRSSAITNLGILQHLHGLPGILGQTFHIVNQLHLLIEHQQGIIHVGDVGDEVSITTVS